MATLIPETIFTRDILGRYVCNPLTEARSELRINKEAPLFFTLHLGV
jgi:hypothetical protein